MEEKKVVPAATDEPVQMTEDEVFALVVTLFLIKIDTLVIHYISYLYSCLPAVCT